MKKTDWIILILIFVISIITLRDLFKPGFYTSHDGISQVVRLYYFDQAVRDGQIPPRWVGELLNGFGYPLFNFSYHLPWLLAEPMHLVGYSIIDSIKMTFLLGFIFSGVTMYFFQKEIFGRLPAICGTVIYLFAPYRFLNIFVRAAIGDATAFIFPPLLFLALYKLKKSKNIAWQWIMLGALALAGLVLSHAMVFLFFCISAVLYIIFSLFYIKNKKQYIFATSISAILAVGISSYYFIPSLIERNWTKFSEIMSKAFTGQTFLDLRQLLYSPWGYGMMRASEGGMSFQLGIAQWLVIGLSSILVVFFILKKKSSNLEKDILWEACFYLLIFFLSIILMLPISYLFWKILSNIAVIDFTWRVLSISIFASGVLAGFVVSKVKYQWLFAGFLIFLAIYANRNHIRINQSLDWPIGMYLKLEKTTNIFDEYTPKWVRWEVVEQPKPKVVFSKESAKINILVNKSNYIKFTINNFEYGRVRVNMIYYPGWTVEENRVPKVFIYKDNGGLVEFDIDKGAHLIELRFKETWMRKIANSITIASFMVILLGIGLSVKAKLKKRVKR